MFDAMINHLATTLGMSQAAAALFVLFLYALARLVAAVIPDTATGALGIVRKAARVVSASAPNRA